MQNWFNYFFLSGPILQNRTIGNSYITQSASYALPASSRTATCDIMRFARSNHKLDKQAFAIGQSMDFLSKNTPMLRQHANTGVQEIFRSRHQSL
jgi:hypothetical protein